MLKRAGRSRCDRPLRDGIARKAGVKACTNAADMSKPAEIADLVATRQTKLGGIDILVTTPVSSTWRG